MRFPVGFRWFPFSGSAMLWLILFLTVVCLVLLIQYIIGLVPLLKKVPKQAVLEKKRTYLSPLPVPQLWEQLTQKTSNDLFRSYELIDWGGRVQQKYFSGYRKLCSLPFAVQSMGVCSREKSELVY